LNDDLVELVRSLMDRGLKIEAIKIYRERTGVGLKEAKDAVEALGWGRAAQSGPESDRSLEDELRSLLEQGQRIGAIKLYRERTGVGLREAKDAVEDLERRGIVVSQRAGCFGVILGVLVFLACGWAYAHERPTVISDSNRDPTPEPTNARSAGPSCPERGTSAEPDQVRLPREVVGLKALAGSSPP
jgi:ribosomal protein L7/L12